MTTVNEVAEWMESIAPKRLAADWDNTGLLLGDGNQSLENLMTCLTLTPESVQEAIDARANMIISHHPLPFRPLKSITTADYTGKLLWLLACNRISVYCPHTAWDSAAFGINAQLASRLGLIGVAPLTAAALRDVEPNIADHDSKNQPALGVGRYGDLAQPMQISDLANFVADQIPHCRLRGVDCGRPIRRLAIACGSGGSLLFAALPHQCDLFLTGEATFHQCLEAQAAGVSMLLIGHFASEKFAMDELAKLCSHHFPNLIVWGSQTEHDPVRNF